MIWWMVVAGAGSCDRCSWTLEYVEAAEMGLSSGSASSGAGTLAGTGGGSTTAAPGSGGAVSTGGDVEDGGSEDAASSGEGATDSGSSDSSGAEGSGADELEPAPALCGNNIVGPGEACDDGNSADDDACPSGIGGCVAEATCGDGFVYVGKEECDDGNAEDMVECSTDCWRKRWVFVTQETYPGDLGGVAGADEKCGQAAKAANLDGGFRAWISDDDSSPALRFNSDEFRGWYVLTNGHALVYGWAGLTSGEPLPEPIMVSEQGNDLSPYSDFVWTNTEVDGHSEHAANCWSWSGPGEGHVGRFTAKTEKWTSYIELDCSLTPAHLYCFQVG